MTHGNPIPDAELAELRRLHAEANGSPRDYSAPVMRSAMALYEAFPAILARLDELQAYRDAETVRRAKADCYDRIREHLGVESNALGAIAAKDARLEAAEREREERTTMAARAQEALRYVMNGLPTNDAVWAAYGNADSARAWLAARDAQQRREGAIEWLDAQHETWGVDEMVAEAQRLRERGE